MKDKDSSIHFLSKFPFLGNTWFSFFLVIIFASLWRLTYLQFIEFKGDEALNLFLATRPLFGHPFPPASLASSVGILNFPLLNYFLFPIVFLSYYPPFVSFCIASLNVLALGAYYLLIAKYFNRLTAFLTTTFFAFAPWAILYSRKIWAQDFLVPLVVALLFCFFQLYKEKKQIYWVFFSIVALFIIQIHQTAGILPFFLFITLVRKSRPHLLFLIGGILLGLLPTIPYIWYELINQCPDCTTTALLHTKLQAFHPDIMLRIFQIMTTGNFHTLFGNTDNLTFTTMYPWVARFMKLSYSIYLLLPVSLIFFWQQYKKYRTFVVISLVIPIIFILLKIQPEMHYLIILLPFLFLFVGSFLAGLIQSPQRILKSIGVAIWALFLLIYISFDYSFFQLLSLKKGFGGEYGDTFITAESLANQALQTYKNAPGYQEMVLAYYVPPASIRGSTPVGTILYPMSATEKNLDQLTRQAKAKVPDPRSVNQLIAYYTYPQNLTYKNILSLKRDAQKFPLYNTFYSLAFSDYLSTNLKHIYDDPFFWIEYPQHWQQTRLDNGVSFSDEYVMFTLFFSQQSLPQAGNKTWTTTTRTIGKQLLPFAVCLEGKQWCGSFVPSLPVGERVFSISLLPLKENIDSRILARERKILEHIVDTMVVIPIEKY